MKIRKRSVRTHPDRTLTIIYTEKKKHSRYWIQNSLDTEHNKKCEKKLYQPLIQHTSHNANYADGVPRNLGIGYRVPNTECVRNILCQIKPIFYFFRVRYCLCRLSGCIRTGSNSYLS